MSFRRTAGSIFWGLTLMGIGGVLLARNLGYPIPIWSGIARYWPVLLIVWGLLKIVDYYLHKRSGDNRPLFSGGEIALLILVIIAGSAVTTAANLNPNLQNIFALGDLDLWDITGNNFEYTEHKEADVPSGSTIDIVNLYGGVEVRPADGDHVILDVRKTVRAANKDEADRLSGDFSFSILGEGSKYRIISNRDDYTGSGVGRRRQYYKSSLTIQVPRRSTLVVDNRNGKVTVQGLTGKQNITNRYGEIEVHGITGGLEIQNRNGSVSVEDVSEATTITNSYAEVTAKNIGGTIEIRNRNGSVEVFNVTGNTTISNSYSSTSAKDIGGTLEITNRNGSVDVSGVKGNASIENSYAPITVENVQGELMVSGRNNSIEVDHVEGRVTAEASYQSVSIKDVKGAITVRNRNGDVRLAFLKAPQESISVTAQYSNVTVEMPSSASFSIDAHTRFGSIDSEFDGLNSSSSNRENSIKGSHGQSGPQISIETRNGDIRIEKRG